jgi:hypothetical protein
MIHVSDTVDPENLKETFMECITPGAIRDEELLAYLAGETVQPFVIEHLSICQRCADQLATYKQLEAVFTAKLYRWDCPPGIVLGEYQLGLLSKEMAAAVMHHLSRCTLCAEEVASLSDFLTNDPLLSPGSVQQMQTVEAKNHHFLASTERTLVRMRERSYERVRRVVATLIPPQPRLAFQRGADSTTDTYPRRYSAEDISASIQVGRDSNRRDMAQLIGFVTRNGSSLETLLGTKVLLLPQTEQPGMSSTSLMQRIDELGNFVFPSIAPGVYTLEMHFPEQIVALENVPVTLQDS